MIFDKIRMTSGRSGSNVNLDFPILGSLPSDSYLLKSIDGLGPPDVDNAIVQTSALGGVFQSRRAQARQLVVRIGLRPNYSAGETMQGLRETLYGTLQQVSVNPLYFYLMNNGAVAAQIPGYVSKFETSIFTKTPEVQITIDCLNPYFEAPTAVDLTPYIPFGGNPSVYAAFDVPGSAETQFIFRLTLTANQTIPLRLYNYYQSLPFTINQNFLNGDVIQINNTPGYRSLTLTRSGVSSSLLSVLDYNSVWYNLMPGQNILSLSTTAVTWNTIRVTPKYWGV